MVMRATDRQCAIERHFMRRRNPARSDDYERWTLLVLSISNLDDRMKNDEDQKEKKKNPTRLFPFVALTSLWSSSLPCVVHLCCALP